MKSFFFNIDTLGIGQCNLRCPSCPVGNSDVKNPTGLMKPELLQQILEKATQELHVTGIGLFSWTEPLLHPQLPELVRIINSFNIPSFLSSNLSLKKDFEPLIEANPSSFRISASGFNQSIYSQSHRGGDIELVKVNMKKLSEVIAKVGATTKVHVLYHRYKGNLDDEILMRDYANSLGFYFQPVWAYFMNFEKYLAYLQGNQSVLSQDDLDFIKNKIIIPFWDALPLLHKYKHLPCKLREADITLDKDGNVLLCCAPYELVKEHTITNFLDLPIDEIQIKKSQHPTCTTCMDNAMHIYGIYGTLGNPEIDEMALNNLTEYYLDKLGIFLGI